MAWILPEKAAADKVNAASKAQFDTDQAAYEKELAKYQADKKAYDAALEEYHTQKLTYNSKVAEKAATDAANAKSEAFFRNDNFIRNLAQDFCEDVIKWEFRC